MKDTKTILQKNGLDEILVINDKTEKMSNIIKFKNSYKTICNKDCGIEGDCHRKNIVYKFTCKKCEQLYIGMTNGCICFRHNQHKQAFNRKDRNNALVEHALKNHRNVRMDFNNDFKFEVLHKCTNNKLTAIRESLVIESLKPGLNRKHEKVSYDFIT